MSRLRQWWQVLGALFGGRTLQQQTRKPGRLLRVIALGTLALLTWASLSEFDQVVGADAKIIAFSKLQTVQHFEGGIVESVKVQAGQAVRADDELMTLSPIDAEGGYASKKNEMLALTTRAARLSAEFTGQPLAFPQELQREAPSLVATESSLLLAKRGQLEANLATLESQRRQRQSELEAAKRTLTLVTEERDVIFKLVERGLEPKLEAVRAERTYVESLAKVRSAEAGIQEMTARIESTRQESRSAVLAELTKTMSDLSQAEKLLPIAANKFQRTILRSPMDGVVNRVLVTTQGGVLKAGEPAIEIVPAESRLVFEAKVTPADIGFVQAGQEAVVKLNTYDFSIFGSLKGLVDVVSSDAVPNEKGETFYIVKVSLVDSRFNAVGKELKLLPGMTARIDIVTGKRSVLSYLSSPITKTLDSAFREK
jgi:adhesin transport system membrane fusion protein